VTGSNAATPAGPLARLRATLRQRRHHRAFRIGTPRWDDVQLAWLEQVAAAQPDGGPPPTALADAALADAATNLWRAGKKLDSGEDRLTRQARRFLRNSHDALHTAGLVIQDHDGAAFHPGQSLEAVIIQPDPELASEIVLETVRPSVYLRDRRIQMGQVIVGTPVVREPDGRNTHA
jgi:hypothetical protein